jgi:GNAT superfamily N-acetyltransferase
MQQNKPAIITLRPEDSHDEAFLYLLYASTRAEEVAAWGWDETQQEAFLRMQFNAQRQSYEWQYPLAERRIILRDGEPAGRMIVHRADEEFLLVDIAILPEHRNSGIGAALIKGLLDEAALARKPVRLHVGRVNPARRLYERLGFVCISDTGTYFSMEWRPGA